MADWTVIQLINKTADFLKNQGSDSPKVDAQLLLADVLGYDRTQLYMNAQQPVADDERDAFRTLVTRRAKGEPIAYILGTAGFHDIELKVDSRVLIPRPETELLVEQVLDFTKKYKHSSWKLVDVGTGSGAIALALAHALSEATVLAIDASADALELARENADDLELRERVKLVHGDVLSPLKGREAVVDIIVSNPPYIGENDPEVEANVRAHEPGEALFSGKDGLNIIKRLLPDAARALTPGGLLVVEFGARQGSAVRALAERYFDDVHIAQDYAGLDRMLVATKAGTFHATPVVRDVPNDEDAPAEEAPETTDVQTLDDQERMLLEAEAVGLPVISLDEE